MVNERINGEVEGYVMSKLRGEVTIDYIELYKHMTADREPYTLDSISMEEVTNNKIQLK